MEELVVIPNITDPDMLKQQAAVVHVQQPQVPVSHGIFDTVYHNRVIVLVVVLVIMLIVVMAYVFLKKPEEEKPPKASKGGQRIRLAETVTPPEEAEPPQAAQQQPLADMYRRSKAAEAPSPPPMQGDKTPEEITQIVEEAPPAQTQQPAEAPHPDETVCETVAVDVEPPQADTQCTRIMTSGKRCKNKASSGGTCTRHSSQ